MNINESQPRNSFPVAELAESAPFLLFNIFIWLQTFDVRYNPVRPGDGGQAVPLQGLSSLNHRPCNQADVFRARAYVNDFLR